MTAKIGDRVRILTDPTEKDPALPPKGAVGTVIDVLEGLGPFVEFAEYPFPQAKNNGLVPPHLANTWSFYDDEVEVI